MLLWIFGKPSSVEVEYHHFDKAKGTIYFKNAKVSWLLSINASDLPEKERLNGKRTFRCINIDGIPLEFSSGFEDLHNESYHAILNGEGFGIEDVKDTVQLIHDLRQKQA
jgi:UDP-N-acetyl-2-amino-2-deoxyglucuronate dehydrogenase